MLTTWNLADPGETAPSKASQFLKTVRDWSRGMPFICKLTDLEPTPHTPSFQIPENWREPHTSGPTEVI